MSRQYRLIDKWLSEVDHALRTASSRNNRGQRANPAEEKGAEATELSDEERTLAAGLMRVNHSGEIAAQALYKGQSLLARNKALWEHLQEAADEEVDHLAWCEDRLRELGSQPSRLAPFWYAGSYTMGALAGLAGDKWSLGFIEETEKQVTAHLESHLERLPEKDLRSRQIIEQMREDEMEHAESAHKAGAAPLPEPIKRAMTGIAKVMTTTSFRW
ncbi:ubiquinone biosynthesis protein COQ7 [gamma proteobacterium HTCC5015]|nr:ubiquinone biosynthesis protein COQ7 [gamma proteobacterium HTCC5015]